LKEGGLASMLHFPINGHTVPAIEAFEKLASGLEVPLYQLFYKGEEPRKFPNLPKRKSSDEIGWGNVGKDARFLSKLRRLLSKTHWVNGADTEVGDLVLKVESRVIRWVIGPRHDRAFTEKVLLPWAAPNATRLAADAPADFTVGVYPRSRKEVARVMNSTGVRFILAGEPEARYAHGDGCYQIVQDPRSGDDEWTRYGPMLCIWTPPIDGPAKNRPCSVIESKARPWRVEMFNQLRERIGDVDGFGSVYGRALGGYHSIGPDPQIFSKYEALQKYAFNAAVERLASPDYLTEKFADPILCEAVPLYNGCPNIAEYAIPGCYQPFDKADEINWAGWQAEYQKRRPAVLRQKELIRTHFNMLSYFIQLTGRLELLDEKRPITLSTIGAI
jgi:Glycosyltransferase family 10 (fucosyltransferase) C-term